MKGDRLAASLSKVFKLVSGVINHEVSVEVEFLLDWAKRANDMCTKGKIRNEMPVHNIEVNPADTCSPRLSKLSSKVSKVGTQNRGSQNGERFGETWSVGFRKRHGKRGGYPEV
jgi:hypothetical protein